MYHLASSYKSISHVTVTVSTLMETAHAGQAPKQLFAWVVLQQEVLVRNRELISLHQPEEFGKGQKETHLSNHLPESFSLASILAEQGLHHQEGLWVRMIG